jgi:hypothetical protein
MIEVKDDFLDKDLILFLHSYCKNIPHYYGHSSNPNDKKSNFFYNHDFQSSNTLINFLWFKISKLNNHKSVLLRCYANIQHFGMDGDFHVDDGDKTFVLMISENLKNNEGVLEIIDNKEKKEISFVQNRLISFPANFLHKGNSPKSLNNPRITIAFKTKFK